MGKAVYVFVTWVGPANQVINITWSPKTGTVFPWHLTHSQCA